MRKLLQLHHIGQLAMAGPAGHGRTMPPRMKEVDIADVLGIERAEGRFGPGAGPESLVGKAGRPRARDSIPQIIGVMAMGIGEPPRALARHFVFC
jgi:hypothetical protein